MNETLLTEPDCSVRMGCQMLLGEGGASEEKDRLHGHLNSSA